MTRRTMTAAAMLAMISVLPTGDANAQPGRSRGGGNSQFASRAPGVGDSLPDGTVYDAQGKEFPLSRLKGAHSVLVFGCLT